MASSTTKLLILSLGAILLSGCTVPFLQKLPFFSGFSKEQAESVIVPQAAVKQPAAVPPVKEAVPTSPSLAGTEAHPENTAPPVPSIKVPTAPAAPEASRTVAPSETAVVRIRSVAEIRPDLSYQDAFLTEDTTWNGVISVEGGVTVAPQTTLTIEPGTTIRFRKNAALLVHGRLSVKGSPDRSVRFTSEFVQAEPGDWQGIMLLGSEKNNQIEHCLVEGADTGISAAFSHISLKSSSIEACRTGARFVDSLATVQHGSFRKNDVGINISDSEVDIRQSDCSGNRQGVLANTSSVSIERGTLNGNGDQAIFLIDSRVGIRGTDMTGNGSGVACTQSQGSIVGTRIVDNQGIGIRAERCRLRMTGNEVTGNAGVGVNVKEGAVIGWDNIFANNGGFDVYNGGKEEVTVIGNWWGERSEAEIAARIHGQHLDPGAGPVRFLPLLRTRPLVRP